MPDGGMRGYRTMSSRTAAVRWLVGTGPWRQVVRVLAISLRFAFVGFFHWRGLGPPPHGPWQVAATRRRRRRLTRVAFLVPGSACTAAVATLYKGAMGWNSVVCGTAAAAVWRRQRGVALVLFWIQGSAWAAAGAQRVQGYCGLISVGFDCCCIWLRCTGCGFPWFGARTPSWPAGRH